jgi:hypothetical protein
MNGADQLQACFIKMHEFLLAFLCSVISLYVSNKSEKCFRHAVNFHFIETVIILHSFMYMLSPRYLP